MTDIKLIVKIDADVYTRLFDNGIQDNEIATDDICEMARALRLGKPLPKGHGRLKDVDAFIKKECSQCDGFCDVCDCDCLNCKSVYRCEFIKDLDSADIIVEADKEVDGNEIKDFGDVVEKITGMPCERLPWSIIVRYEDKEKDDDT